MYDYVVLAKHTYIKNFKPSNIQDTNEIASGLLGIQHLINSDDHPQEHFLIDGLAESHYGIVDLILQMNNIRMM